MPSGNGGFWRIVMDKANGWSGKVDRNSGTEHGSRISEAFKKLSVSNFRRVQGRCVTAQILTIFVSNATYSDSRIC